jgi:pimeloyl-ACP methyl ester carboxylesterase
MPAPRIVEFESAGIVVRGWLYEHAAGGARTRPIVVMTHGFSATATGMVADRFADVFHAAGLNVLLFDGPSLGMSDGEPRRVINRWTQLRAYRDALTFASSLPTVDADRLAIWGDSMSGGSSIGVAAFDERVRAMAVQVPACGRTLPIDDPDGTAFGALRTRYLADVLPPVLEREGPMPVVSPNQRSMPSLLEPITAFRWFIDYGGQYGTGWDNEATFETSDTPVAYHGALCAPHLRAASMWVIANEDEMPGAETPVALHAYRSAPEPKELLLVDGGHFGLLYHPSPLFDQVSAAQADFFVRHLG